MPIRQKINARKSFFAKALLVFITAVLLLPSLAFVLPGRLVRADSADGYRYTDDKYSAIRGNYQDDVITFDKTSAKNYDGGTANGCHVTIKTNDVGSTSGTLYRSDCLDGNNSSYSISIAKSKTYVGSWVDHGHIVVDGVTYVDDQFDDTDEYVAVGQNNGCDANKINNFPNKGGGNSNGSNATTTQALITINAPVSASNRNCVSTQFPIRFTDTQNYSSYFVWVDSSTIQTSDGTAMTFVQKNGNGPFYDDGSGRSSDSSCKSQIVPDANDPTHGTLILRNSDGNPFPTGFSPQISGADMHDAGAGCQQSKPLPVNIANPDNANKKAPGSGGAGAGDTGSDTSSNIGCDFSTNPLSWVICPVVDMMSAAIDATDSLITQEMVLPTQQIFCLNTSGNNDTCDAYYTAWATFRNIALGLIAIAGLIIVIAQALGMEVLDAYTIRRTLPRILVAAIAITLSWPLMNFAVTLSNNLGFGIRDIIVAPFHGLNDTINLNFSNGGGFIGGFENFIGGVGIFGGAAIAGVSIWIATGGMGIVLSYVATAGLAVLIAILVLILRQIAVIMLILLSPIAIVAYILPNTQRVFRMWWESFVKALLMFPMIAAFIAAGRVFAAISLNSASNGVGGVFHGLIGFVAYFAPYFMIPLTFRFSGSVMSGLGNAINQRAQGAFNGLASFRQGQRQKRIARARGKGLYRQDLGRFESARWPKRLRGKSVGSALNTMGLYTLDADEQIPLKLGAPRKDANGNKLEGFRGLNLPGFRRGAKRDLARIDEARRQHTQNALQEINPGYKGARVMAGLYKGAEHDYLSGLQPDDYQSLVENYGIRDAEGRFTGDFRAAESAKEREEVGRIMSRSSSKEAREAGAEMVAAAPLLEKYNLSHETQRVDPRFLGLMAAAQEGRLGIDDIVENHNKLMKQNPTKAQAETKTLQQIMAPKRTSAARGHGIEFAEDGTAINVYHDPLSEKAQTSIRRESVQDMAGSKAEDFQGLHGETWINGLSDMQMHFDPAKGVVEHTEVKGPDGKLTYVEKPVDSPEYRRAKELQAKVKAIAMYSSGDSGIGLEMKRMWQRAGLNLGELEFDRRAGQPIPRDLIEGMQAAEPPEGGGGAAPGGGPVGGGH